MTKTEILDRLAAGESIDSIADELATTLNEAVAEDKERKAAEAKKREAEEAAALQKEHEKELLENATEALNAYIEAAFPDFDACRFTPEVLRYILHSAFQETKAYANLRQKARDLHGRITREIYDPIDDFLRRNHLK